MFEYLEPDASGASNLPPSSRSTPQARPERVRHMLYGSLAAIDRTIKILHALGYTDPNDWSDPIPVPPSAAVGDTTRSLRLRSATGAEASGVETPASSEVEMPASSGVEMPAASGVELWMAFAERSVPESPPKPY